MEELARRDSPMKMKMSVVMVLWTQQQNQRRLFTHPESLTPGISSGKDTSR